MLKSPWVITTLVVLIVAALAWLLFRTGKFIMAWFNQHVEPNKPRWSYIMTPLAAALAPLAAFSALLPSYLNQQRSDQKFMAEASRSRNDSQYYQMRVDTETQENQYAQAQARFGSTDEKTRAQAALQLADLALQPKPTGDSATFDDLNYPHFAATGAQFALALGMEPNADVRAALNGALRKMIAFAAEKKNIAWQTALAQQLADSNRRIAQAFTRSLAHYAAANDITKSPTLTVLTTVAPLVARQPDTTRIVLKDCIATDGFQADRRVGTRLREAATDEQKRTAYASLLAEVQTRAAHLMDARDILAEALRALKPPTAAAAGGTAPPPAGGAALASATGALGALAGKAVPGLPAVPAPHTAAAPRLDTAESRTPLNLSDCVLAGGDLHAAYLAHADLTGTEMNGADLTDTDLTNTALESARHLPSSVTRAHLGLENGGDALTRLKRIYPSYAWPAAGVAPTPTAPSASPAPSASGGGAVSPPGPVSH